MLRNHIATIAILLQCVCIVVGSVRNNNRPQSEPPQELSEERRSRRPSAPARRLSSGLAGGQPPKTLKTSASQSALLSTATAAFANDGRTGGSGAALAALRRPAESERPPSPQNRRPSSSRRTSTTWKNITGLSNVLSGSNSTSDSAAKPTLKSHQKVAKNGEMTSENRPGTPVRSSSRGPRDTGNHATVSRTPKRETTVDNNGTVAPNLFRPSRSSSTTSTTETMVLTEHHADSVTSEPAGSAAKAKLQNSMSRSSSSSTVSAVFQRKSSSAGASSHSTSESRESDESIPQVVLQFRRFAEELRHNVHWTAERLTSHVLPQQLSHFRPDRLLSIELELISRRPAGWPTSFQSVVEKMWIGYGIRRRAVNLLFDRRSWKNAKERELTSQCARQLREAVNELERKLHLLVSDDTVQDQCEWRTCREREVEWLHIAHLNAIDDLTTGQLTVNLFDWGAEGNAPAVLAAVYKLIAEFFGLEIELLKGRRTRQEWRRIDWPANRCLPYDDVNFRVTEDDTVRQLMTISIEELRDSTNSMLIVDPAIEARRADFEKIPKLIDLPFEKLWRGLLLNAVYEEAERQRDALFDRPTRDATAEWRKSLKKAIRGVAPLIAPYKEAWTAIGATVRFSINLARDVADPTSGTLIGRRSGGLRCYVLASTTVAD